MQTYLITYIVPGKPAEDVFVEALDSSQAEEFLKQSEPEAHILSCLEY